MRVYGYYDVVVVGGGASGSAAALAAAREGASVILIETLGTIGGMINVVGPPGWAFEHLYNMAGERIIDGIVGELHTDLYNMGVAMPLPKVTHREAPAFVDIDWCGLLMFEKLREAGVTFMLHTMAVDVLKEGNTIQGVIVENTSGRMAVMGKVIIEATGEGDIAARAGVPYSQVNREEEELDPPSITFHMDGVDWKKVTEYYREHPDQFIPDFMCSAPEEARQAMIAQRKALLDNCDTIIDLVREGYIDAIDYHDISAEAIKNGDMHPYGDFGHFFTPRAHGVVQATFQHSAQVPDCDTTDITEYSAGEVEARRQVVIAIKAINKYLPGYENAYLTRITPGMRTREGRHTVGDYQMTAEDAKRAAKFDDVIAKCCMPVRPGGPFHSVAVAGQAINENPIFAPANDGSYDIPYRALVPKGIDGMLLSGKLVSLSQDFKRDLLPDNMIWGQAAGTAAAICAKKGITPRELEADVSELQAALKEKGAILDGTK